MEYLPCSISLEIGQNLPSNASLVLTLKMAFYLKLHSVVYICNWIIYWLKQSGTYLWRWIS